jgi:hypothetical protein
MAVLSVSRRCPECQRSLPTRLDRIPRWPIGIAVAGSLVYPALRVMWVFGGTLGTTGGKTDVEPVLAWALIAASLVLTAFTIVLWIDRGPTWVRALLALGGLLVGCGLLFVGGAGVAMTVSFLMTEGPDVSPGARLTVWTFLTVYASWLVTGIGVLPGSWRYWAHRRDDCATCSSLLA